MKVRQSSKVLAKGAKGARRGKARIRRLSALAGKMIGMAVVLALVAGGAYGGWRLLSSSDYLSVKEIKVTGTSRLSEKEVVESLGIPPGANLLSLDLDELERRLVTNPWVREAIVKRKWPGILSVHLKEHRPVAVAKLDDSYLVDSEGTLFTKVGEGEKWRLPVITGLPSSTKVEGRLPDDAMKVVRLLKLSSKRPSTLGTGNIREIKVVDGKGFLVYIDSMELRFGPDDIEHQFSRAEKVLYHIYRSGLKGKVAKVDLAYGEDMAWAKLKGGKRVQ